MEQSQIRPRKRRLPPGSWWTWRHGPVLMPSGPKDAPNATSLPARPGKLCRAPLSLSPVALVCPYLPPARGLVAWAAISRVRPFPPSCADADPACPSSCDLSGRGSLGCRRGHGHVCPWSSTLTGPWADRATGRLCPRNPTLQISSHCVPSPAVSGPGCYAVELYLVAADSGPWAHSLKPSISFCRPCWTASRWPKMTSASSWS